MTDELDARIRLLEAERARPDPPGDPSVVELMRRLIRTLHAAYLTPPDRDLLRSARGTDAAEGGA
ncbi:hypothetical protein [Actinomadura rupiterrae]|uniref:hypothetical protein n=1 Tax=Actinomadura rupiterrae TaxID=559627 RepID=UPI0020A3A76A|nr:hypothetical protein [Actinomadura rupiterrae]MCP2339205.1 hypothetical protein [Actinomadura rupiterrae]